jgi:hypothetical protein
MVRDDFVLATKRWDWVVWEHVNIFFCKCHYRCNTIPYLATLGGEFFLRAAT